VCAWSPVVKHLSNALMISNFATLNAIHNHQYSIFGEKKVGNFINWLPYTVHYACITRLILNGSKGSKTEGVYRFDGVKLTTTEVDKKYATHVVTVVLCLNVALD